MIHDPPPINLIPFFESQIGLSLNQGSAEKLDRVLKNGKHSYRTRYFKLKVIAVDKHRNGVWFEGWSGLCHAPKDRYHGVTFLTLNGISGSVHAQMVAADQLEDNFDKTGYLL